MKIDLVEVCAATHAHLESADWAMNMEVKCILENSFDTWGQNNHHFQVCDMINEYEDGAEMGFRAIRKRFSLLGDFYLIMKMWPRVTSAALVYFSA